MFDHRNRGLINRFGFCCSLLFVLAACSGMSAAPPYPSTLSDYVTMYEISSYKLFQHDRDAYKQRLERGKLALERMKKHGGRSAKAATKMWFETATYSKDTADQLPGLPALAYLKDVDETAIVDNSADEQTEPTPETVANLDESEAPMPETVADTATEAVEEAEGEAESNTPQNMAAAIASLKAATPESPLETDAETEPAEINELAATGALDHISESGDAVTETPMVDPELAAADWVDVTSSNEVEAEVAEIETMEIDETESSDLPFSELAIDEESAEVESVESGPFEQVTSAESTLSEKAKAYNVTAEEIQSEALVALGGDGSDLIQVVEKIEAAADSRSGIQAQIDLTSSFQPVQAMSDLKPIIKDLHQGIFKFPKSPDGLSFETAVDMLERLQDVEAQLEELTKK